MSTVLAELVSSSVKDGKAKMKIRVPAFTQSIAERRAKAFVRGKGISAPEVDEVSTRGSASIPGQTVYIISIAGQR